MSIHRVAIIFDNTLRPDTTGVYCRRALGRLVDVEHFLPSELDRIPRNGFDLYLQLDDGLNYEVPPDLRPSAWWAIDTHLDFDRTLRRATGADFVFAAQRDGAEQLRRHGIGTAMWLPLGCDPEIHGRQPVPMQFDVSFVGNVFPGPREALLRLIQEKFPKTFVGRRFFSEMARTYSESRIVFNCSVRNDVNMRVFEVLASGSLLLTNDLRDNGQDELFRDGIHLATYRDADELLDKIRFYLEHSDVRERVAATGRKAVLEQHTYAHRMRDILTRVGGNANSQCRLDSELSRVPLRRIPASKSEIRSSLTSIILVTSGQLKYTRLCLDSIRERTGEPCELIVVDNGSNDGTVEYLRSRDDIKLIVNFENRGYPAAANQGMLAATGQNLLLLNNDTVVTTGWLRRMLAALDGAPEVGLVGPCSNQVSGEQQVPVTYDRLEGIDGFAHDWAEAHDLQAVEIDRLVGFCLLIRRDVIDRIGLVDERFGIGNFEDDDLCRRAIQAGYRCLIARDAFVHHFGSQTFRANGIDLESLIQVNREKFLQKWGSGNPNDETPTRDRSGTRQSSDEQQAIGILANSATDNSRIQNGGAPRFAIERAATGGLLLRPAAPMLSLCMIVRDNETTIGQCLESIRPWVDEIVVVDTGSKDRTPEICRQYGSRMFEFPWCNDFSAARNESLHHARGEWIFWMDSDDTMPPECGSKLRGLVDSLVVPPSGGIVGVPASAGVTFRPVCDVDGPPQGGTTSKPPEGGTTNNILGYIMQVHCPGTGDDGHVDMTVVDHLKLIRNRSDLRFSGRIHEQLLPAIRAAGGDVAWTDIYVVHSGSDHSAEGFQRKLERDLRILHQELAEQPDHPFVLFNLGMTYADAANHTCTSGILPLSSSSAVDERGVATLREIPKRQDAASRTRNLYDTAIDYLRRCLAVSKPEESHLRKAHALLTSSLAQADRHDEAWACCQQGLALYPDDKELLFRCAMLHHHFGRLHEAAYYYIRVLNDPEERHFTSIDRSLAGYKARHNLALVYDDMGRFEEAETQWRLIVQEVPDYSVGWHNLGTVLCRRGRYDEAVGAFRQSLAIRPGAELTMRQLAFATAHARSADTRQVAGAV